MTTPTTPDAVQMPPLPVVGYCNVNGFLRHRQWLDTDEPLCKVSDAQAYAAQQTALVEAKLAAANDDLQFIERWANHHGTKPHMTAEQALGCIQHYPPILAITRAYTDGKVPETRNPWAELAAAEKRVAELTKASVLALNALEKNSGNLIFSQRQALAAMRTALTPKEQQ